MILVVAALHNSEFKMIHLGDQHVFQQDKWRVAQMIAVKYGQV